MNETGQPNETPLPDNVLWGHPRVKAANDELYAAAESLALEKLKFPHESSFDKWSRACCRLENAAIAFGDALREYRV